MELFSPGLRYILQERCKVGQAEEEVHQTRLRVRTIGHYLQFGSPYFDPYMVDQVLNSIIN